MAGLQIHREDGAGGITLRLEGVLDGRTAQEVRASLEELRGRDVVLDFTHLREFKDSAVGVLTVSVVAQAVTLKGLATHHERMFRYFGVATGVAPHRPYYTPEDVFSV
ncbi:STAS domain-containing protein [Myxococcus sp. K15C18031901]|uniref:STAS domain-containing protein n=1 Tax=Myxococcus dinghuensis TaxID=2906761 RepID=UPI0020A7843E|nr:STAS domain-containing protein [Myxococcus dinghuensis]MCP3101621.1 STAS domain-containing protein [Myxococcus dinghuensis]